MEMMRTHVLLPVDLVDEIDAVVGQRKRSRFIAEAVAEKLRRSRLESALDELERTPAVLEVPGWETSESAAQWVAAQRVDRAFLENWVGGRDVEDDDPVEA
jgi:metal-responsive CopG/Arc/MetJ family transcriptional regulator